MGDWITQYPCVIWRYSDDEDPVVMRQDVTIGHVSCFHDRLRGRVTRVMRSWQQSESVAGVNGLYQSLVFFSKILYELKCQTPIFLQYFYKIWAPGLVTQHQLLAARDVTERVMLWTSYVSPVMSHHDSSKHQPDTKTHIPLSANQKQILCHEIFLSQ